MRFIKNGPSIPDELLVARDEGRVVFFCGAGVSRAFAGLPDFFGLAKDVIKKLGVSADDPVVKILNEAKDIHERTGVNGLISADRMFGLLERDFTAKDIEHVVAQALKPNPDPDISAHRILINLATTPEGKVRLVTTNFDRLFENCDKDLFVWRSPKLPDPSSPNELNGIVYLHGCANQDYNGSEGDGFVLSSSGFGRAYLSEGWATAFIKEILDRYIVVFIGYSADDPPIHYLLEALNQHGQLSGIYAFQDGTSGDATAKWEHKGVEAIAYSEDDGHRALWDTLATWAQRARNPDVWIQSVIELAMKGPEHLQPYERGQVAHIISTSAGAKKFCETNPSPPAEWLCVFDSIQRYAKPGTVDENGAEIFVDPFGMYGLDSDTVPNNVDPDDMYELYTEREIPSDVWDAFSANKHDQQNLDNRRFAAIRGHLANNISMLSDRQYQIGGWIGKVADQPAAVWWAARQTGLHPDIQKQIKHQFDIHREPVSSEIRQVWQYLFENWCRKTNHFNNEIFSLKCEIKQYGWNRAVAKKYVEITRPYIKLEQNYKYRQKPPEGDDSQRINNLMRLDVKYPQPHTHDFIIPDEWLAFIVSEFRKNLEIALQLETEINGFGLSVGFRCPIVPEDSPEIDGYHRLDGLCGSVIVFSQLFERLIKLDVSIACQEFSTWPVDDEKIFARLRLWAAGKQEFVSAQTFSDIVLALSDDAFWDDNHQRDLLLALATRWNELHINSRNTIEQRLLRGREKWLNGEDDQRKWNAYNSLNRITWLAKHECNFSFDFEVEVNRLKHIVPFWKPEDAKKAASSNEIRGGLVSTDPEYSSLLSIPLESVLTKALEVRNDNNDYLTEKDPFSGLSEHHPVLAIRALTHVGRSNEYPQWAWSTFLHSEGRKKDKPKLTALIAERLSRCPDSNIIDFIHPASLWVLQTSKQLASEYPHTFDKIIFKLIKVIQLLPLTKRTGIVRGNREADWANEAINAPAGIIAEVIFNHPKMQLQRNSDGLPFEWRKIAKSLLALSNDSYRYVLVIFCRNINWLYAVDPDWTERNLLSVLDENNKDNQAAFWAGFFWRAHVPKQPLYIRLKSYLLNLTKQQSLANNKYRNIHARIILAGWGNTNTDTQERLITNDEMRKQILDGGDDFRSSILRQIKHWSNDTENAAHIDWSEQLLEFFRDVWPRQKAVKTASLSASLCDIALVDRDCFSKRIEIILPLLTTIHADTLYSCNLQNLNKEIAEKHPAQTLELLDTILPDDAAGWPSFTGEILQKIYDADIRFHSDERLLELSRKWNAR
jgi:hypothetical protein